MKASTGWRLVEVGWLSKFKPWIAKGYRLTVWAQNLFYIVYCISWLHQAFRKSTGFGSRSPRCGKYPRQGSVLKCIKHGITLDPCWKNVNLCWYHTLIHPFPCVSVHHPDTTGLSNLEVVLAVCPECCMLGGNGSNYSMAFEWWNHMWREGKSKTIVNP